MFTKTELDATVQMVSSNKLFLRQPFTIQFSNDVRSEAGFYFFAGLNNTTSMQHISGYAASTG